jgi:hypothetical protein
MSLRGAIAFYVLGMLVLISFAHSMSPVFPIMPSCGSDQVKLCQHECRRAFSFSFMAVLASMFWNQVSFVCVVGITRSLASVLEFVAAFSSQGLLGTSASQNTMSS